MSGAADRPSVVALEGRIRRRKLRLERMNPLDDPAVYEERLVELVALEAQLRDRGNPTGTRAGDEEQR